MRPLSRPWNSAYPRRDLSTGAGMRLTIFGASGATGKELVAQALGRGHRVTAVVRTLGKLEKKNDELDIVHGDVANVATVARAIIGSDAVLSALGVGRPLRHDPAVVQGIRNIVKVMEESGSARLIYLSFLGVKESRDQAGFVLGKIAARFVLKNEVADHEEKEGIIRRSKLDWTIVRPPAMTNAPHTGAYRDGVDIRARSFLPTISRADVAEFMLNQVSERTYFRIAVAILP
jgi:putative NADH-flavin reductase